ncbi:hypothetical protein AVEN_117753-1 [Araneus ventricosus]|uniref:Uncharacterized protein n=1 Tax=Araneus ventricosus TaxID=182803 RepID=A0A4Y2B6Y9_ARAVE|nr:hypothetical protein AVEN_117753-1 [Araneus ventricosus]
MHTLTKFLVHTTNVQCVLPWSPGTHPKGNPVPSRRSIACFHKCPSQQQRCDPAELAALLALEVHKLYPHITPQQKITWPEIWRPEGGHGKRETSSRPARPIQRCGSSLSRKSRRIVLQ